jgi:hypothetical protein
VSLSSSLIERYITSGVTFICAEPFTDTVGVMGTFCAEAATDDKIIIAAIATAKNTLFIDVSV